MFKNLSKYLSGSVLVIEEENFSCIIVDKLTVKDYSFEKLTDIIDVVPLCFSVDIKETTGNSCIYISGPNHYRKACVIAELFELKLKDK